jgi:pyridoxamine 5'-phosphate oxidase
MKDANWLNDLRVSYETRGLQESQLLPTPMQQFQTWLTEAIEAELPEPNAMVLATASTSAQPKTRTVLCKLVDERGFVFFSNTQSAKAEAMSQNPQVAISFLWLQLHRQVQIIGEVEQVSRVETEQYFATRARSSQIGAWASPQSETIASRDVIANKVNELEAEFKDVDQIPAPPFWGGYLVRPSSVEFWQGARSRLHDRLRYDLADPGFMGRSVFNRADAWVVNRVAP